MTSIAIVTTLQVDVLADKHKAALLHNMLECLASQLLPNDVTALNDKLASICSAAYLTLIKHWIE